MVDVEMTDAPALLSPSPSEQIVAEANSKIQKPVFVTKPIPHTFDLGNLLLIDANPVMYSSHAELQSIARECAQSLINQLLTTCPISSSASGVHITLPAPTTALPREKPIPSVKEPTKWERFAAKKGIKPKRRDGKLVYDEVKQDWLPKYGYKGQNKGMEDDWLVEVDDKTERQSGEAGDPRREKRAEKKERIRRQDRRQRANETRSAKPKR